MTPTRIARFVQRHFYTQERVGRLREWFIWHESQGLAVVNVGASGLNGLVAWRPVVIPPEESDFYGTDTQGNIFWIDLWIATRPGVSAMLWQSVLERVTPSQFVSVGAYRKKNNGRRSVHSFGSFSAKILNHGPINSIRS